MTILRSLADNIGDLFGTSKLALLNRTVFSSIMGTEITRKEYNMCDGTNLIPAPSKQEISVIKGFDDIERSQMSDNLLGHMVDNGTVFSDRRINSLVIGHQKSLHVEAGSNPVTFKVMNQMSERGSMSLERGLHRQTYGF